MEIFRNRKAVLATMHGKEKVIAPIFKKELGIDLIIPDNFDTDKFGTFTMDKKRKGDQLEAARFKAQEAMKLTGLDMAVASEGSFSPDINIPFINSNTELVIFIDKKNDLEIIGYSKSMNINASGKYVSNIEDALSFAKKIGFPEYAVILRKNPKGKRNIFKGIKNEEDLKKCFTKIMNTFFTRKVYIETDLRAHMNPVRMDNIEKATLNLVENIKSLCVECNTPGFCISDVVAGLECSNCGMPTNNIKYYLKKCKKCNHEEKIPSEVNIEDMDSCGNCNP